MSIPGSANPLLLASAAGAAGYNIERSLRFNSADSAYLSRTPASAGNRRTWTFSAWVKRSLLGSSLQTIIGAGTGGNAEASIRFNSDDTLEFYAWTGGYNARLLTTQVFRDVSAWYHLVAVFDTPNATADQRIRLYVNGIEITTFSSRTNPTQNYDGYFNNSISHTIGDAVSGASPRFFNGYLAECHLIDGQALTPSSFTEVSATTGQLIPKTYAGTYTGNSFWLKFNDNSAATAATLGKDSFLLGNNWTPNNLSVTAGSGNDSLVDTPTSYGTDTGAGGEVRGNYCTLNPFKKSSLNTLSNGNLDFTNTGAESKTLATFGLTSGKWYWECVQTSGPYGANGIAQQNCNLQTYIGNDAQSWGYLSNGGKYNAGASNSYGSSWTNNDVIGVAFDADAGKLWFSKNGTWQASGDPGAGTNAAFTGLINGPYFPAGCDYGATGFFNFGQRQWAYQAPAGFKALVDTNLPAPVVAKSASAFQAITYTGTGANATIPNVNTVPTSIDFTPDLVWIKGRSGATDHALYDSVRDVQKDLVSNSTAAETTQSTGLTAFGTNTFNIGTLAKLNTSSSTYVGWCWDAGTSTVTNTQGSITSSVRANASAGFSIVTYTGNGSSTGATVGHGLGVEPSFFIIKNRSASSDWVGYHKSVGSGFFLILNSTSAAVSSAMWDGAPSSTVLKLNDNSGGTFTETNTNGQNYVAYCFAPVTGYSSFGSYTGNGSADGPFVYTGFRPRWIMIKISSTTGGWGLWDTARAPYNVFNYYAPAANSSAAEASTTGYELDILSNGFKCRGFNDQTNPSGATIIYAAFAEHPFQYARAR